MISDLVACKKRHGVYFDRKTKQRFVELREELMVLEEDPAIKDEIEAKKLFLEVDARDDPAKLLPVEGRPNTAMQAVIAAYERVASRHPETVYGRKSKARVEALRRERTGPGTDGP